MFDLIGKHAIVTGGSRGIGYAIAADFCQAGAEVVIIGTSEKAYEAAQKMNLECGGRGSVQAVIGDVGIREKREELFSECIRLLGGKLDILVNNAGVNIRNKPVIEYPYGDFDRMMAINLEAPFFFSQMAVRLMLPLNSGRVISITSIGGMKGTANGSAVYNMTKSAVNELMKSLTCEYARYGITFNAVAPGFTVTDLAQKALDDPKRMEDVYRRIPDGRLGQPEDIVGAVRFLASDAASHVNGVILPVDGGNISC